MTGLLAVIVLVAVSVLLGAATVAGLAGLLMRVRRRNRPPTTPALADSVAQLRQRKPPDAPRPDTT